jgi:hypothetical protein
LADTLESYGSDVSYRRPEEVLSTA